MTIPFSQLRLYLCEYMYIRQTHISITFREYIKAKLPKLIYLKRNVQFFTLLKIMFRKTKMIL